MPTPKQKDQPVPPPPWLAAIQAYGGMASMLGQGASELAKMAALHSVRNVATNVGNLGDKFGDTIVMDKSAASLAHMGIFGKAFMFLSKALAVAGIVMGSVSIFQSIWSMFQNGFSILGSANVAMSALSVAMGVNALFFHMAFIASMTGPVGWIVAGAVIVGALLASWIMDMLGVGPSAAQKAANDMSHQVVTKLWTAGPVLGVGVGMVAMLWGMPHGQMNVMQTLTVPAYYLAQTLANTGSPVNIPVGPTPTTLIEPGDNKNDPSKVMIVTDTGQFDNAGNHMISVQSFALFKNLQFVSSMSKPTGCYIPAFLTDAKGANPKVNNAYVAGLTTQQKMLESILYGGLTGPDAQSAMKIAAAANKDCVIPEI